VRRLTLLRHAHAADAPAGGRDFDRPLSPAGEAAARTAARHIGATLGPPDRLRVSPAVRTRLTAQALCELAFPSLAPDYAPELYLASLDSLLEQIAITSPDCRHLMLIGHNPGLSELCALLTGEHASAALAPAQWTSLTLGDIAWAEVGRT
jgi:phosphohistidine phosphatase